MSYRDVVRATRERARAAPPRAPLISVRAAEARVAAAHSRENLACFSTVMWHLTTQDELVWSWHIDVLCAVTEAVLTRRIPGAIINLPPGLSKSTIASRMSVPWAWTDREGGKPGPSLRVIGASHSLGLQRRLNRHRRAICRSADYQDLIARDDDGEPLWRLDPELSGVSMFATADTRADRSFAGGWCAAASRKGGIATGDHADLHIYDDPLNGRERHTIERMRTNAWIADTMASRFGLVRMILGVMQMLHADDPTHALLRAHPQILRVVLPMVYDAGRDDYDHRVDLGECSAFQAAALDGDRSLAWMRERMARAGLHRDGGRLVFADPRADGALICPGRYGWDHVRVRQENPGVHAAEDQQAPSSASASVIVDRWWRRAATLPIAHPDELLIGVDTQSGDKVDVEQPDWTVFSVWARWGTRLHFIEEARARLSTPDMARVLFLLAQRWVSPRILVERRNAGPSVVSLLRGVVGSMILVRPEGQDIVRIEQAGARIQAGDVYAWPDDEPPARPRFLRRGEAWPRRELRRDDPSLPRALQLACDDGADPVLAVVGESGWVVESLAEWNHQPGAPFNDRPTAGCLVLLATPTEKSVVISNTIDETEESGLTWAERAPWGRD